MNSVKKIAIIGGVLLASSSLLVSFTQDNGGEDKKKKYQIIHHSNGETVTHDTIVSMSSAYTPEQFVADKGISSKNLEIIKIPFISNMDEINNEMKTVVCDMKILGEELKNASINQGNVFQLSLDTDENSTDENVEIFVEVDENGEVTTKKSVNGVEVEMTEEELEEIQLHHNADGKFIQMRCNNKEMGDHKEYTQISIDIDDEGNKTIKKVVNGEEVEITEDELDEINIMEMADGDIHFMLNHEISEELEEKLEEIEIEVKKMLEDCDKAGEVITKYIEFDGDGENNFEWESEDGNKKIVMISDDMKDNTIVLVTENYNENAESNMKMTFDNSSQDLEIYPNPNDGKFTIRFESDDKETTSIIVTDINGKKVFQDKIKEFSGKYEKELNLKEHGPGMYTITIQNGNNKEVQKVMIK